VFALCGKPLILKSGVYNLCPTGLISAIFL
jgi:hypothetical protein